MVLVFITQVNNTHSNCTYKIEKLTLDYIKGAIKKWGIHKIYTCKLLILLLLVCDYFVMIVTLF